DLGVIGATGVRGASEARDVNDDEVVVGSAQRSEERSTHAFRWSAGRGMEDLTAGWPMVSTANAVNDAGAAAGVRTVGIDTTEAVLWPAGGGSVVLPGLGGRHAAANGLNDAGTVVGFSTTDDMRTR